MRHFPKWASIAAALGLVAGFPLSGAEGTNSLGTLRVTVVEAASGLQTPCTVSLVNSAGETIVENRSFASGFRCDGQITRSLPAGKTRIRVSRGFEFRAVEEAMNTRAGETLDLNFRLERIVDLRQRGWYAGESHAHMNHGEKTIPVDFDYVALTARAEDLQYLSLAQVWSIENPTPENLEVELKKRSRPDCALTWNLEAPKNYYRGDAGRCLGHCWTLAVNGRTPEGLDVIDTLLQASAHDYQSAKPSYANFESHQLIRAQGGASFYTHPARWWTGPWGGQGGYPKQEQMRVSNMAVELPLDTLLGPTFDGIDLITGSGEWEANAMAFDLWCLLLNHGYRVAGTASSDACFDRVGGATPGVARLYTVVDGDFSLAKTARAAAQGRTFVTTGPLLLVSLDGNPPGSALPADGNRHQLKIDAWASGNDPQGLTRLELLRNGIAVQTNLFPPGVLSFNTNLTLTTKESSWFCVRIFGSNPRRERAISGAFFLDAQPHQAPPPLISNVRVTLQDAATGVKLRGTVTELTFLGTIVQPGKRHSQLDGESAIQVPANRRLQAEVPGYVSQVRSLFFDNSSLLEFITHLSAEDLLKWDTFERVRSLAAETAIVFRMEKDSSSPKAP